ncbi:MAG: hypothetical protein JSV06_02555 [Myxococcales bacterium]|nr:MAG: hypothetical protein JSV06_02555 [Myxococcales bacterium]
MTGRSVLLALLCMGVLACNDDVSQFVFEARILDGDGGNPAAGTDATTLRIGIAEGELAVREFEYPIEDGQFDATLEFASFSSVTRIRIDMEGPTTALFTAPPAFVPSASSGFLRVVAAAPSSCEPVTFNAMEAPRADFGFVQSGTFALAVGGTSTSDEQVEFFDALEWDSRLFLEDLSLSPLGPTRAATIGEGEILVLPTGAAPFIFNMLDASQRITLPNLYVGAGPQSALVSIRGVGAMVIGGEAGGAALADARLVQPGGVIRSFELSEPRSGASAAALGEDVLVVGGDATGTAEILLSGNPQGQPVAGVMDGVRAGGILVSDGESQALWLGGTDAGDALRQDTLRFDDCPASCAASAGPTWTRARLRVTVPEYTAMLVGGEGSRDVEEVQWNSGAVAIERVLDLDVARAGAGAIVYESGAFVVTGGDDGSAVRDDFEFCTPAALQPL